MQSHYLLKTLRSAFDTFPSLTLDIIVYRLIDDLCEFFWTLNMQLQCTHAHSVSPNYAEHYFEADQYYCADCTCVYMSRIYLNPKDK